MVIGYKCFNKGLVTRYGDVLEVGKEYTSKHDPKFGKSGYHFCKNMEDTFRYFDSFNDEVDVCIVEGSGKIEKYDDYYYGYYDMYCSEKIKVLRILTREDIINYGLNLNELTAERFISTFGLTSEEIKLFKDKFFYSWGVLNAIAYYQENDKEVYKRILDKKL